MGGVQAVGVCSIPGCPHPIHRRGRCQLHSHVRVGRPWMRIRGAVLARHKWCQRCGEQESTQLHHIVPVVRGSTDDVDNLLCVCARCHRELI